MNQSKHTPGPWNVDGDATVYGPRFSIANDKEQIGRFEVADCKGYKQEREANARLIASAPDLLAALERLAHPMADDEDLDYARGIISKAKGNQ
jgi:hypothetical protein